MGCGHSNISETNADVINRNIEEKLKNDCKADENVLKLLLVGAGGGGKSTIAKQMQIIHGNGYNSSERMYYRPIVYSNVTDSFVAILGEMEESQINFSTDTTPHDIKLVLYEMIKMYNSDTITKEMGELMITYWQDKETQKFFVTSKEYRTNDSSGYFLNALSRISQPTYIPTEEDVLKSRSQTTGIHETRFNCKGVRFRMIDVGGQRSQRKKWIHCFDDVSAIIFCTALSEYDICLEEDSKINRMHESLELFKFICNNKFLLKKSMILFLNKTDLLRKKIQRTSLNICFPDYNGPNTYNAAIEYIKTKFADLHPRKTKQTYIHLTCAIDTPNIQCVFNVVSDLIFRLNNREAGMV